MANPLKRIRVTGVDGRGGRFDLGKHDPVASFFDVDDESVAKAALKQVQKEIGSLQNTLYAERTRALLVVLQGMDTSGKDGAVIAAFNETHPQGVVVTGFKAPTSDEAARDFLWRVHAHVPAKGMIGVFNRSHYEAVIAERVLGLADRAECKRRYAQIVDFERMLVEHGTAIVKCFLHISPEEQKVRLQSRLDEPDKHWKFNPNDLVERKRWDLNRAAYADAIRFTSTKAAPWHVVPSDSKEQRNMIVATLVRDALARLDPKYPPLDPAYRSLVIE